MSCKFIFKSRERAGSISKVFIFFFLLSLPVKGSVPLKQMPRLINASPLAQQLSNKQDISVGLLSVFCVTESGGGWMDGWGG